MSDPANVMLNRLLRGVSTDHVPTVRQAWRALLATSQVATPLVLEKLRSDVWRGKPVGPSARYLGVLLALLHELDADAFGHELQRLRGQPLHPMHQKTVDLLGKRFSDKAFGNIANHVPVYISDDIAQPDLVFRYLKTWSRTRDLAISNVTRVDVIAHQPEMDYLGRYNFFYDAIVLTWHNELSFWPLSLWRKISMERTFYHEVGHHFFQHSEGGQVATQEDEARSYERMMLRNAHPVLVRVARCVMLPGTVVRWGRAHVQGKKD